jgi:hypothetical protein
MNYFRIRRHPFPKRFLDRVNLAESIPMPLSAGRDSSPAKSWPSLALVTWAKCIKPARARVGDHPGGHQAEGRGADLLMTARQLSRSRYCFTKTQPTSAMQASVGRLVIGPGTRPSSILAPLKLRTPGDVEVSGRPNGTAIETDIALIA